MILIGGYLEWTGNHAVTAADAFPGIIINRTGFAFAQSADNAGRDARRLITMHALDFHIIRFFSVGRVRIGIYDRVGVSLGPSPLQKHGFILKYLFIFFYR